MGKKKDNNQKSKIAEREEAIQSFWEENQIFEKTLEKDAPNGEFVFYDGPPFATGLPHYGHLLAGTMKDAIPRYQTMRGKRVERRWGWDCHGLPLENQIEEELGIGGKDEIEDYGVDKFNYEAQNRVLRYRDDWKEIIPRTGRWVDMDRDYRTMDAEYTESVWWAFKNLYDKGLIYEGFKSMHLCPRCGTTLSNFEVSQGYKEIKDIAVTVKLELKNEPGTYILVWTTTPWTLPGNSAAALNPKLKYVKVEVGKDKYILAKSLLEEVLGGEEYKVLEEIKPDELLGEDYKPPFDYYEDKDFENKENAWKIYEADYVDDEEGTGLVHLAPAFGEEDMLMAQEKGVPLIQHVDEDGKFKEEVKDLAGLSVKPRDTKEELEKHLSSDIEVLKLLQEKDILVKKETVKHSYPHCWRCDTPLLNYASSSWFVEVTKIKEKLISENKEIHWVPKEIGSNRFGDWLENVRDWAISRSRYWGAPLPVWRNEETGEIKVIGSIDELKEAGKSSNNYFLMRHGEAESNVSGIVSSNIKDKNSLTEKGKKEVEKSIKELKNKKIERIYASPFSRTKETAEMVADALGINKKEIVYDERIKEIDAGKYNGKLWSEYHNEFDTLEEKYINSPKEGENYNDVRRRVGEFFYEIDKKEKEKNILVVSHGLSLYLSLALAQGLDEKEIEESEIEHVKTGEVREFQFYRLPHNQDYELDLHMPFIDEVEFESKEGGKLKRIPEVFDCWFESGSMPWGQHHYPFENLEKFNPQKDKGYPADFIAEGLDQTRGWFYSMLVLSVGLFDEAAYKNVIVNGLVLAEDGKKMSKRLKNYPDPLYIINKYGADALRYYLLSSPVVEAQDLNFKESGVDEVVKKLILKVQNIYSFYEMYADESRKPKVKSPTSPAGRQKLKEIAEESENILDRWLLSRLESLRNKVTKNMDDYRLNKAARPFLNFVDDFSVWYIRRSRDRFKTEESDKKLAQATTLYVLIELSKLLAPFTPFLADDIYRKVGGELESVHLETWPKFDGYRDEELEEKMKRVRKIVSLALDIRAQEGVKVRQPLSALKIKEHKSKLDESFLNLIKEEINVKDVQFSDDIKEEVEIDLEITPELKEEGMAREFIRRIQSLRKKEGLVPEDEVDLLIYSDDDLDFVKKYKDEIKKTAGVKEIKFEKNDGDEFKVEDNKIIIKIT